MSVSSADSVRSMRFRSTVIGRASGVVSQGCLSSWEFRRRSMKVLVRLRKRMSGFKERAPAATSDDNLLGEGGPKARLGWGSCLVLRQASRLRQVWSTVMTVMLLYTGTILPFKICFLDFRIDSSRPYDMKQDWKNVESMIYYSFVTDLALMFLSSFEDAEGCEVCSMPRIAAHYLRGPFIIDLVACLPDNTEDVLKPLVGKASQAVTAVGPLLRLLRLLRIAKLVTFIARASWFKWLMQQRSFQLVNMTVGLLWVTHLTACGWYLCAALHQRPSSTWVARRTIYSDLGVLPLTEADPLEQWIHAMYFVLVVFITVGFGDISAFTMGEMFYVGCMMMFGAIVHSLVVSKMIHVVTNVDHESAEMRTKRDLVQRFASHAQLDLVILKELTRFVERQKVVLGSDEQDEMRKLLTLSLPDGVMEKLHGGIFSGNLIKNRLVSCVPSARMPPRFPLLLACSVHSNMYEAGDMVYYWSDHPWSIYLVQDGTFAYVARPHPTLGGICEVSGPQRGSPLRRSGLDSHRSLGSELLVPVMRASAFAESASRLSSMNKEAHISPYMLFSSKSYFGEFEMFISKPRNCSIRCEVGGTLLVLNKVDFRHIVEEFPHFEEIWKNRTLAREGHRKAALKRLRIGMSVEHFAAYTIQFHYRKWHRLNKRISRPTGSLCLHGLLKAQEAMGAEHAMLRGSAASASLYGGLDSPEGSVVSPTYELDVVQAARADVERLRREVRVEHAELRAKLESIAQAILLRRAVEMHLEVDEVSSGCEASV